MAERTFATLSRQAHAVIRLLDQLVKDLGAGLPACVLA